MQRRQRRGLIHAPDVLRQCPMLLLLLKNDKKMIWVHCLKDGKSEFTRMAEYSSSTTTQEQRSGKIHDCPTLTLLGKRCHIHVITNKSMNIWRVNLENRWVNNRVSHWTQYWLSIFQTNVPNKIEIKVRRESILEDSYRIINSVTKTDLLKTKLWVEFEGEAGKICRRLTLTSDLTLFIDRTWLRWLSTWMVLLAIETNVQSLLW